MIHWTSNGELTRLSYIYPNKYIMLQKLKCKCRESPTKQYLLYVSSSSSSSIYLSLHRVPKDVGSMNKISPSVPILSFPISLEEGAASNDIIFPSFPWSSLSVGTRDHFHKNAFGTETHMLLILHTWPNQDSCDSVMRARIRLGLNLQEEILKRTSSLRTLFFQVMLRTFL